MVMRLLSLSSLSSSSRRLPSRVVGSSCFLQQQQLQLQQLLKTSTTTATAVATLATTSRCSWFPTEQQQQQQQQQNSHQQHQPHQQQQTIQRRNFHFGTREYAACFENLPNPDTKWLRQTAIDYLNNDFDAQRWYDDPIVSMLNGQALNNSGNSGERVFQETKNALGQVNGKQILASADDLERIRKHISTYSSSSSSVKPAVTTTTDLRDIVRQIEEDLFTLHSGFLIGNQCVDFQKQDGITEMQEAIQANVIERRLNDQLLQQERDGILTINRQPIYVSTVSNFTNFLDLSRKTLRSLEVGIPVIILSRSNTCQHSFRWTQQLIQLGQQYGLDAGMITYCSASLKDIIALTQSTACDDSTGNLYATCSRQLAREMNQSYHGNNNTKHNNNKVIASTGGPNTLVLTNSFSIRAAAVHALQQREPQQTPNMNAGQDNVTDKDKQKDKEEKELNNKWSLAVRNAIRQSATIESAGQCTALRHAVVPTNTTLDQVHQVFEQGAVTLLSPSSSSSSTGGTAGGAPEAMEKQQFDAVFANHAGSANPPPTDQYHHEESTDAFYKLSDTLPGGSSDDGIPEYWRKVVVDFTRLDVSRNPAHLQQLIAWLNQHQPISLAINGPRQEAYNLALQLFDQTALVVYTIGSTDEVDKMPPALTCQARPQDGECFGEFPPRSSLRTFTKFPVIVPSSNPSYDATYRLDYLKQQGSAAAFAAVKDYFGKTTRTLLEQVQDDAIRGYCVVLIRYLQNVDQRNPKQGFGNGSRTTLWGLQRPPLGSKTFVHVAADTPWDAIAPLYTLFHVTTARNQIELSIHPPNGDNDSNEALIGLCRECKLAHTIETMDEMKERLKNRTDVFAVETISRNDVLKENEFPMAGQFTSLYLPLGHIKSTMASDEEFVFRARAQTNKWLSTLF